MTLLPRAEFLASLPRRRMVVSAFIRDTADRVLCVDPIYKETWHLPGGSVESGESPSQGCRRECLEELGIAASIGRLLVVGHLPPETGDPDGAMTFVYDASIEDSTLSTLTIPPDELAGVSWLNREEQSQRLSALARELVRAGWDAVTSGGVVELDRKS